MQHRQVEAAAVPGNQLRRVFLDAVEEALDQLAFVLIRRAQRPHLEAIAFAQRTGNGHHPVQMQGAGNSLPVLAALVKGHLRHILRRCFGRQRQQCFQTIGIGNSLDVENERRRHFFAQPPPAS